MERRISKLGDGPAVVIGSAPCGFADYDILTCAYPSLASAPVFAVKYAGVVWEGQIAAWCSLHPERLLRQYEERLNSGRAPALMHLVHRLPRSNEHWSLPPDTVAVGETMRGPVTTGSSSLFAARCAIWLGFRKIVLCGCPMDYMYGHIEVGKEQKFKRDEAAMRRGWDKSLRYTKNYVRSMSGYTRQLLGEPDSKWFKE